MSNPADERRALLLGLGAVLAWSTVATAFKLALRHVDHVQLLFLATIFSLLALGSVLVVQGKTAHLRRVTRPQLLLTLALGLVNPFIYYLVLFKAYDLLPAQVAQPLNFTWALTLSWLSVPLLGQKLRWRDGLAGVVCYLGVVVIATRGDLGGFRVESPLGVGLALGSTILWSLYWIGNRRSTLDPVVGLFLGFAWALPCVTVATALLSDFRFDLPGVLGGLYVGAFEMGFTFVLWLSALRLTSSTARVANLIFLAPFLSLVFIRIFVGEHIAKATLVGLVLIVGALWWQGRDRKDA
ncbi:MAG: DMT family transporter [bacterium]|nr:DMT family transporter [bacterium]